VTPLEAAWLSVSTRLPIEFEAFSYAVDLWDLHPVVVQGETAGALLTKGPEIHACILPEYKGRWLTRKELRILNQIIEKHGYAQTSATTLDGEYFVNRLGFVKHGEVYRKERKWA
jgi:Zn-finger nucleic acid-binding protein